MPFVWIALLAAGADVEAHLGLVSGRSLVYRAPQGTLSLELHGLDGGAIELRGSDGTSHVASFEPESGLLLHSMSLADGSVIEYERPVALLPAMLERGEVHSSQRRFVRRRGEEKLGVGAHYFEAELLGTSPVETAAGRFPSCLEVRRHALRMDFSGGQEGYDVTEWYAPGIGVVRIEGTHFVRDEDGNPIATEPIDLELERLP